jgi:hypothetical protein
MYLEQHQTWGTTSKRQLFVQSCIDEVLGQIKGVFPVEKSLQNRVLSLQIKKINRTKLNQGKSNVEPINPLFNY